MKTTFIMTTVFTYEQTVDTETGEILETKLLDKKVSLSDKLDPNDETPIAILEENRLVFNKAALQLMDLKNGTLMDVRYKVVNGNMVPVLGTADAFNVEGGNRLTKSGTLSFRGAKHQTLAEYGTRFILEKTLRKGEFNLVNKENNVQINDKIGIDEAEYWESEPVEIENPDGLEADDDIFKF